MEEKKMTMAELLAEEDERLRKEAELAELMKQKQEEERRLEKKAKYEEYLAERERKRQEAIAERERLKNMIVDKTLVCKKCGEKFLWSAKEQKFYKEKGFYPPSICKDCRSKMVTINNFRRG